MKNYIFILIVFCSISIFGCKNKRPKAQANFKFIYVDKGGVSLKHTGIGYFRTWVVDDKDTVDILDQNLVYYFKENGTHKVKLIVSSGDVTSGSPDPSSETDTQEQTVEISGVPKKLKIEYFKAINIPFYNQYGNAWDSDNSGPDITFSYKFYNDSNQFKSLNSPLYSNLTNAELPVQWIPSPVISVLNGSNNTRYIDVSENTNYTFANSINIYDTYFRANGYPSVATFSINNSYDYSIKYTYEIAFSYSE